MPDLFRRIDDAYSLHGSSPCSPARKWPEWTCSARTKRVTIFFVGGQQSIQEEHGRDGTARELVSLSARIERAEGFAQILPAHKYKIVKALQERNHLVGMTGYGVDDAPALKQAEIGIAVSGATDAARAAADLVLTEPGLSVIIRAVEEARYIFERMNSCASNIERPRIARQSPDRDQ